MRFARILHAELRKALTLPATLVAAGISVAASVALAAYNAGGVRAAIDSGRLDTVGYTSPVEAALSATPLGTVGAVILGVVAISSEYAVNSTDAGGGRLAEIDDAALAVSGDGTRAAASRIAASEPYCRSSFDAVFSPIPGTPGSPSDGSPRSSASSA